MKMLQIHRIHAVERGDLNKRVEHIVLEVFYVLRAQMCNSCPFCSPLPLHPCQRVSLTGSKRI